MGRSSDLISKPAVQKKKIKKTSRADKGQRDTRSWHKGVGKAGKKTKKLSGAYRRRGTKWK